MANAVGHAAYEILNAGENRKLSIADQSFLFNSFDGAEVSPLAALDDSDESESEALSESEDEEDGEESAAQKTGSKNQHLAVGYKHDRSFVTHGDSSISVFRHTRDDDIELSAVIKNVCTLKGKAIRPSKILLHDEDRSLLMTDHSQENGGNRVYRLDLELGKVVDEWNLDRDDSESYRPISSLIPERKYAQTTSTSTLIGMDHSSLFRIDSRLSNATGRKVQDSGKSYTGRTEFSCGATNGNGELAVASAKGEIRLFDQIDKRAKTLLPGFGDAIIGIDVTEQGHYIVATCKTYILFFGTAIKGGAPGRDSGFTKSMGATKPTPVRLQLRPEHVAYMNKTDNLGVSFTPARFNTGPGDEERCIISSTGPYVITWNVRRVKLGHLYDYQIRRYQDDVVADNFRFAQDKSIVVTLPEHVTVLSKKSLNAATPTTLSHKR